MTVRLKYSECRGCRFNITRRRVRNPICKSCNYGELFEQKTRRRTPNENELMTMYEEMNRDD